ncbi:hypothetical protein XBO1_2530063 [Xenorhabdus bovienii str. oregonense]|uniref:Uncharacterized protein n=1 Tax=Xenorhabdus bovienii str. oregonense TaxID=1398202 RepID=A0A077P8G9_XENBV|nr:hypothetical protein XBO1_2530063 [Xenorhabdus bovienii str. oregonense]
MPTQCRLANMTRISGSAEMPIFGKRYKVFQIADIHSQPQYLISMIELINKSLYARGNKTIKFIKKITITSSFHLWAVNSQYSSSEISTVLPKNLL